MLRLSFSFIVNSSSPSTGGSLTDLTSINTVAMFESSTPLLALYVKVSIPLKFGSGVYINDPLVLSIRVPFVGPISSIAVRGSLLRSKSLINIPIAGMVNLVSSLVTKESFTAIGESPTSSTVIVTVAAMFESSTPSLAL